MEACHSKVLKVKPLRSMGSLQRLFRLDGDLMNTQEWKRKLPAVFRADVAGYSRLMGEYETRTEKTLETYKRVMFSLPLSSSTGFER